MIEVTSAFDGGAIECLACANAQDIRVAIRRDLAADFAQWFYFRVNGVRGERVRIAFTNARATTYPDGWEGYQVVASYDRARWFRVATEYRDGVMTIEHDSSADQIYLAYFEPYSYERHLDFLARAQSHDGARVTRLATSVRGRPVDALLLGQGPRHVWVIARQHPGETMAEWFVEGLIERLLDPDDALARAALNAATFHLVPNMNPDGAFDGNLRTNARGANLNREWVEPSLERSPEVAGVRAAMLASGVDLFLDAHGDEALPYVFVSGCEMLPNFSDDQRRQQQAFIDDFKASSPDFQDKFGYAAGRYRADALKLASKWVGDRFRCVSLTLEMPFKDNAHNPQPDVGWDGARSKRLGHDVLVPMVNALARIDHDGR